MKSKKSAQEIVGISLKDFAKRKRAASRDRKHGRGVSWLQQLDQDTGNFYYVSESTGETARSAPEGAIVVTIADDGRTSFHQKGALGEAIDDETGDAYYYHKETGERRLEHPALTSKASRLSSQI